MTIRDDHDECDATHESKRRRGTLRSPLRFIHYPSPRLASNPPEVELYQERIKDLPHGFKRWKNSMHWGRVKSKREAIEALVG